MSKKNRVPMLPQAGKLEWTASVNEKKVTESISSDSILLDVLRDQIGTLGVKRGCDMGTCGCCAVLVNGQPRLSCLTLTSEVEGCEITTIEGIADGHHLSPIQETFTTYGGSQCGFCSPGFLIVITALLEENDNPSEAEIKNAIEGNLCRCTGYQPIVESVQAAAEILRTGKAASDPTSPHSDPHPGFMGDGV
jgi:aerobic-type carbon monoxide dehydrogenase small subunit (CoxS/CutS family)